jgi:hypothetical protein
MRPIHSSHWCYLLEKNREAPYLTIIMKINGSLLLWIGVAGTIYAFFMDTSVATLNGRVHNIGLISERNIILAISLCMFFAGIILKTISKQNNNKEIKLREQQDVSDFRACPFCAELIKKKAIVCRYCNNKIAPDFEEAKNSSNDELSISDEEIKIHALARISKFEKIGSAAVFIIGFALCIINIILGGIVMLLAFLYHNISVNDNIKLIRWEIRKGVFNPAPEHESNKV